MTEDKCASCGKAVDWNNGLMSPLLCCWFCNDCYGNRDKMDAFKVKAGLADKEVRITKHGRSMLSVDFVKRNGKEDLE